MPTRTRSVTPVPTYTAYESLPDGRERILVSHLRYTQRLAWRFPYPTWAVDWRQDPVKLQA